MDEMESKLNSILGDPQMMQQIMSMAQALGQSQAPQEKPPEPPPPSVSAPSSNDLAMMQKLYSVARQSGVDKNQQALLKALGPYLRRDRIVKLERAMRAAKIAGLASNVLGSQGLSFFSGR